MADDITDQLRSIVADSGLADLINGPQSGTLDLLQEADRILTDLARETTAMPPTVRPLVLALLNIVRTMHRWIARAATENPNAPLPPVPLFRTIDELLDGLIAGLRGEPV